MTFVRGNRPWYHPRSGETCPLGLLHSLLCWVTGYHRWLFQNRKIKGKAREEGSIALAGKNATEPEIRNIFHKNVFKIKFNFDFLMQLYWKITSPGNMLGTRINKAWLFPSGSSQPTESGKSMKWFFPRERQKMKTFTEQTTLNTHTHNLILSPF